MKKTRFGNLSIRKKLIVAMVSVATLGIMLSYSLEHFRIIKTFREEMIESLSLETQIIGNYSVTTLLFDDPEGAREILEKLSYIPHIIAARLVDSEGKLFATYGTFPEQDQNHIVPDEIGAHLVGKYIYVNELVTHKQTPFGKICIIASTDPLKERARDHLMGLPLMGFILLIFVLFISYWFQKIISDPILKLAEITRNIAQSDDYSIRIKSSYEDEIGLLYRSFNTLLEKITLREKERDAALRELQREQQSLELRVDERTQELATAKSRAEESDHLKSAFLANMSHEIRTPLNAILGFASVLTKSDLPPEKQQKYHSFITASGEDLLKLINDILDIAKIEANQIDIYKEDITLNNLLENQLETLKQSLAVYDKEEKVQMKLKIPSPENDYILNTDELRLKQILTNIVHNAIKFTDEGFIEIGYMEPGDKTLSLYVKDSGIGMAPDKLDSIFDRFVKLEGSEQKLYKGSGLGLSISQKLCEHLGAELRVESEKNKGSVFYINMPYKANIKGRTLVRKEPAFLDHINLDHFKILVAEDNEANYLLLKEILNIFTTAKILWARNGQEAVELCSTDKEIDLVLMDIMMPVMKGDEATMQIKSIRKDLPIIAQTAHASSQEEKLILAAGCDDVIKKPIQVDEFLSKILYYKGMKDESDCEFAA